MGRLFLSYLDVDFIYACKICKIHFSEKNEVISKSFQAATGRAYLFNKV